MAQISKDKERADALRNMHSNFMKATLLTQEKDSYLITNALLAKVILYRTGLLSRKPKLHNEIEKNIFIAKEFKNKYRIDPFWGAIELGDAKLVKYIFEGDLDNYVSELVNDYGEALRIADETSYQFQYVIKNIDFLLIMLKPDGTDIKKHQKSKLKELHQALLSVKSCFIRAAENRH